MQARSAGSPRNMGLTPRDSRLPAVCVPLAWLAVTLAVALAPGGCPLHGIDANENENAAGNGGGADGDGADNGNDAGDAGDGAGDGGGGNAGGDGGAANHPPIIHSFSVAPQPGEVGQPVTFTWSVSDPDGDDLTLTLRVEGGDAHEYLVDDPLTFTSQTHVYNHPGDSPAFITVSDGAATADQSVNVSIDGPIRIEAVDPACGGVVNDNVHVIARITARFDVAEVRASIGDRETTLMHQGGSEFVGGLSLDGLPRGPVTLVVHVRDVVGNELDETCPLSLDRPPTIEILEPAPFDVISGSMRLHVTATDDGEFEGNPLLPRLTAYVRHPGSHEGVQIAESMSGSFDASIDLIQYNGNPLVLYAIAVDSANQSRSEQLLIYVFAADRVTSAFKTNGMIVDADATRVLALRGPAQEPAVQQLHFNQAAIVERATGDETVIDPPAAEDFHAEAPRLTPRGAVLFTNTWSQGTLGEAREWDGTTLTLLADSYVGSIRAAGDFIVWWDSGSASGGPTALYRRDVVAAQSQVIALNANSNAHDLAADGTVAYLMPDGIHWFHDGADTLVAAEGDRQYTDPVTDGQRALYAFATGIPEERRHSLAYHDGTAETVFIDNEQLTDYRFPPRDYQIVNGWIACTRPGTLSDKQVWRRDPAGAQQQVTAFGTRSVIDRLAPDGTLTILNNGRRYLVYLDGTLRDVGSEIGRAFAIDGTWYLAVGNTLLRVEP